MISHVISPFPSILCHLSISGTISMVPHMPVLSLIYFVINPYDLCVANKKIEGKQMTIFFHVDDCKLSHRRTKVMDSMIEYLWKEYKSIFEDVSGAMTVSRGKVQNYLGMTLDYTVRGQA
jgi:hypothetical protein